MDISFNRFAEINENGLIVCLDADCTVSENYLLELSKSEKAGVKGLSLYYEHPLNDADKFEKEAITSYEIFLHYYIQALRYTAYPHAFHTIGSSMAVRTSTYAKIKKNEQ